MEAWEASKNHTDLLISGPTVKVTNEGMEIATILEEGRFQV